MSYSKFWLLLLYFMDSCLWVVVGNGILKLKFAIWLFYLEAELKPLPGLSLGGAPVALLHCV